MNKKIILFGIISLFIVSIFIPIISVSAAQVYVGVTISNTENIEGSTFCLLESTQISIWEGATQKGSTKTISVEACIGDDIWSNLVDIIDGQQYSVKLEVPFCTGGEVDTREVDGQPNIYCWYEGDVNEDCYDVCGANNTTILPVSYCIEPDPDCVMLTTFFGSGHQCYSGDVFPMLWTYDNNFRTGVGSSGDWCDYSSGLHKRICTCVQPISTFNFPFTASF